MSQIQQFLLTPSFIDLYIYYIFPCKLIVRIYCLPNDIPSECHGSCIGHDGHMDTWAGAMGIYYLVSIENVVWIRKVNYSNRYCTVVSDEFVYCIQHSTYICDLMGFWILLQVDYRIMPDDGMLCSIIPNGMLCLNLFKYRWKTDIFYYNR